ncbi:MFS transporter [Amaricoccus solimangrovi]|uniref:MFS transporter n=1 Tax=Amaricoccus solimangrovi TaxID=2589815 RepID=A0A501WGX0_9RHOB|nr:MFS transporter [Amaricoccus solimangrovi]TPE48829.1 MFS transporter [Amaricoccus solimangrovi]
MAAPAQPEALSSSRIVTPILVASCLILLVSFGIRASFGLFQIPIASEFGWPRAEFSLAIAIQNLAWGIGQPVFGAIAERFGDRRAIILGALLYAAGLLLSAQAVTPVGHQMLNVLIGFGIAGTGFGVILAIVGRAASAENRSLLLGITTAAGSAGQVLGPPVAELLLGQMAWPSVFVVFAVAILAVLLALPFLGSGERAAPAAGDAGMAAIVGQALRDPSFALIFIGFFSCGYQLGFITAHFPAFITEVCAPIPSGSLLASLGISTTSALGAFSIAVIGLANIGGTLLAGALGRHFRKKYLLAQIYAARTIVSAAFILTPMTPATVLLFSLIMGALWLATVPLTSGLVAQIWGLRYMGTLYGIVFLSHQIGAFLGVWLGGRLYDAYGSYTAVWWIGVGVGAFSALVHLPIRERPAALPA